MPPARESSLPVEVCGFCGGTVRILETAPGYVWLRCDGCQEYRAEEVIEA